VALGVFALYLWAPEFLKTVEIKLYDVHFKLRGVRSPGDQVVVVAIDEKSLETHGRWPWPRALQAQLVRAVADGGAKVIALDILLSEPEVSGELRAATRVSERLRSLEMSAGTAQALRRELAEIERQADGDGQLQAVLGQSGRVVLPLVFEIAPIPETLPEPSGRPLKSALVAFRHYPERLNYPPPSASEAKAPIPRLAGAARALGHVTMLPDHDGTTRWEALIFEYRGYYYASLGVQAVSLARGVEPTALKLDFGRALEIGSIGIPVDPRNRMLIDYAGPPGTFRHLSASDVLAGKAPGEALRDRIVFVGTTAAGTFDLRVTPVSPILAGVEKHANVAENLLAGRFLRRPDWVELVEAIAIVIWPFLMAGLLPRLRPLPSFGAVVGCWGAMFLGVHLAFRSGLWLPLVYPTLALGLTFVGITVYRLWTEERQRLWIKRAFQRFVNPEVVERLVADPASLKFGGETRTLTILFSDIRSFTTYSEQHPPEEVVHMLREYLTRMSDQILNQGGTLDKYIGDGIMALFGAPVAHEDHADRACRAALGMTEELERLHAKWTAEGREPFRIGIGMNTGEVVVGNLGSEQLFDYTVIGDPVNIAARLESLNKEYKPKRPILISEMTYEALKHKKAFEVHPLGEVLVKGKTRPVVVYELRGLAGLAAGEVPVAARVATPVLAATASRP
jgi:adenylate cyclase